MATISITLAGSTFTYTLSDAHAQRVLNVYDPSDSQTNAQTARAIANGWVQSLTDQVRAVEVDTAKQTAEQGVVSIAITPTN